MKDFHRQSTFHLNQRGLPWPKKRCQRFSQIALEAAGKSHVGVGGILI
jgi:hypothetical protein